jgi:hypothetical protein
MIMVESEGITENMKTGVRRACGDESSHTGAKKIGASEGIRTLDTHVGNVMLYQAELRSLPKRRALPYEILA